MGPTRASLSARGALPQSGVPDSGTGADRDHFSCSFRCQSSLIEDRLHRGVALVVDFSCQRLQLIDMYDTVRKEGELALELRRCLVAPDNREPMWADCCTAQRPSVVAT